MKSKEVDTGSDWAEVKEMCNCEHRILTITASDFVCPAAQVSNILKPL